jgi:uncharacterized membrane protein
MVKKNNFDVVVSLLSYLFVGIIWFFLDKKVQNSFTKFHVKQAINLFIFSLLFSIIGEILMFIPLIGWLVGVVIKIFILILFIIGIVNSINYEKIKIPLIGNFASIYLKF